MDLRVGTIKKAECQIIDSFEMWYWRRLLRVPWTARKSNQLILKEINHEYSLEVLMLKLKLHYFAHLMWRTDSLERFWCWESLKAGGKQADRGWNSWMASLIQWIWVWVSSRIWWWTGKPGMLCTWGGKDSDMTEWLNWIDSIIFDMANGIVSLIPFSDFLVYITITYFSVLILYLQHYLIH